MIKYFLQTQIFALLTILIFALSCNGQSKTDFPTNRVSDLKTIPVGKPKLIKTQGSNEYATVYCGLQDKEGNLWFGTSGEGVYRFDGKLFTQFTTKDGLNSNSVNSILQDNQGNLWLGTSDGLCKFNGKKIIPFPINGKFLPVFGNTDYYNATSKSNTVWSMLQDKKGTIWLGTGDGVYCYDEKNFSRFLDNPDVINKNNLQLRMVDCIFEDKNGIIWFASGMPPGEEGICRYDGKNVVSFKPKNEGWFRKIIENQDGNLLLATRIHGVLSCNLSAGDVSMASFSGFPQSKALLNNSLMAILKDKAGNIWMASDYGKYVGDTLGGVWCYKQSSEAGEKAFTKITANEVSFMLEDKAGNIWLGTRNTGLYRYDGKTLTNFSE
ncbi:ligand-binding sensor domain-containing protein [Puia sp.]|jgi:ligand-binding sensor domain-containing protein|uniref:ligand-binding sensor domain-containing protein n=1 Tax=Puia sp. TaxID=2045100 RepID=UPI002F41C076